MKNTTRRTHIENHLLHMLAGEQTTATNASDALLSEMATTCRDSRALEQLGRFVLAQISTNLKSGVHAQKALLNAMGGNSDD